MFPAFEKTQKCCKKRRESRTRESLLNETRSSHGAIRDMQPEYLPEEKQRAIVHALLAAHCGADKMSLKAMQIMVDGDYVIPDNIMQSVVSKAKECPHGDRMNAATHGDYIVTCCCLDESFDTDLTTIEEILSQFPRQIDVWQFVSDPAGTGSSVPGWVCVSSTDLTVAHGLRMLSDTGFCFQ